jgi:hypothetical protein
MSATFTTNNVRCFIALAKHYELKFAGWGNRITVTGSDRQIGYFIVAAARNDLFA